MALVIRAIALCALLSGGCLFWDSSASIEVTCLNACSCLETNPVSEEQCNEECVADLSANPLPQDCLDCVARASCEEIEDLQNACAVECGIAAPQIVEVIE